MAALLEMVPLVPVLAVVPLADWVPAQLARDDVTGHPGIRAAGDFGAAGGVVPAAVARATRRW